MNKRCSLAAISTVLILLSFTGSFVTAAENRRPKLLVGLVIDQMRWDFLYRYAARYGQGGFKRLLNEGFTCHNAQINYVPSFTACGHASIYTGSVPALHGIVGNEWINRETGNRVYCTDDSLAKTVGSTSVAGKMSPRNLIATTIGDELKLATNFRSKVIGIAIKDRGGILPAGHAADAAYWFDEATGYWITSSYYRQDLPGWVNVFNAQKQPQKYLEAGWNTLYPLNTYQQSTADNTPYEGHFKSETQPIFPHRFNFKSGSSFGELKSTPFANTLTLDFAKKAIEEEAFGKDDDTDLLTVSLSATDYIGHQFGPNSIEIEDTYLRLDKDLEDFLLYLDKTIGKDNYTFFLASDHGAAHNPDFLLNNKMPAGYWDAKSMEADLNLLLEKKHQVKGLIRPFLNYHLNLNYPLVEKHNIDINDLKRTCINYLNKQEGIAYAIDLEGANSASLPGILREKITNGYNRRRSGAVQIMLQPGYFQLSTDRTGSIHGSWNPYDAHIPLIFMGKGVNKGSLHRAVSICDIAPTLSALLNIQEPNSNIGKVVTEALK